MRSRLPSLIVAILIASACAGQITSGIRVKPDAYGAGWNGDNYYAPSRNAVYDKIEAIVAGAVDPILDDIVTQNPGATANEMLYWTASGTSATVVSTTLGRGLIAAADAAAAKGLLNANHFFDIRDYGAAIDGTADDAAEVQAAINAASAAGGGIVFLHRGRIRIETALSVPSNVQIVGSGMYASTFELGADIDGIVVAGSAHGFALVGFGVKPATSLGADTTHAGIYLSASTCDYLLSDLLVTESPAGSYKCKYGVYVVSGWTAVWQLVRVHGSTDYGLYMAGGQAMEFSGCDFGVSIGTSAYVAANACNWSNVKFQGSGLCTGLTLAGDRHTFLSPWFELDTGTGSRAAHVTGSRNTFIGGSWTVDASGDQILCDGSASYNEFRNLTLIGGGATKITFSGSALRNTVYGGSPTIGQISFSTTNATNLYLPVSSFANLFWGDLAVQWDLGDDEVGFRLRSLAADVASDTQLGLFSTSNAGSGAPFTAWGNLVAKARTLAGSSFSIFTGSPSVERARINATYANFYQDVNIPTGCEFRINGVAVGSGTGDITDVWTQTNGNANALTAAAGDSLDATNADSSIPWPVSASKSLTAEGQVTYDTTDGVLVVRDEVGDKVIADPNLHVSVAINDDGTWDSEAIPIWQAPADKAVTIKSIRATVLGSSTPSLVYNIEERAWASLNSAGTDVFGSDQTADANGEIETTFSNASIAAGAHLVFTTGSSSESGTVDWIQITIYYQIDRE